MSGRPTQRNTFVPTGMPQNQWANQSENLLHSSSFTPDPSRREEHPITPGYEFPGSLTKELSHAEAERRLGQFHGGDGYEGSPVSSTVLHAAKYAGQTAASYIPQGVQASMGSYWPSEEKNPNSHPHSQPHFHPPTSFSLPSSISEKYGARPGEYVEGVGSLPGNFSESSVALLPDERNSRNLGGARRDEFSRVRDREAREERDALSHRAAAAGKTEFSTHPEGRSPKGRSPGGRPPEGRSPEGPCGRNEAQRDREPPRQKGRPESKPAPGEKRPTQRETHPGQKDHPESKSGPCENKPTQHEAPPGQKDRPESKPKPGESKPSQREGPPGQKDHPESKPMSGENKPTQPQVPIEQLSGIAGLVSNEQLSGIAGIATVGGAALGAGLTAGMPGQMEIGRGSQISIGGNLSMGEHAAGGRASQQNVASGKPGGMGPQQHGAPANRVAGGAAQQQHAAPAKVGGTAPQQHAAPAKAGGKAAQQHMSPAKPNAGGMPPQQHAVPAGYGARPAEAAATGGTKAKKNHTSGADFDAKGQEVHGGQGFATHPPSKTGKNGREFAKDDYEREQSRLGWQDNEGKTTSQKSNWGMLEQSGLGWQTENEAKTSSQERNKYMKTSRVNEEEVKGGRQERTYGGEETRKTRWAENEKGQRNGVGGEEGVKHTQKAGTGDGSGFQGGHLPAFGRGGDETDDQDGGSATGRCSSFPSCSDCCTAPSCPTCCSAPSCDTCCSAPSCPTCCTTCPSCSMTCPSLCCPTFSGCSRTARDRPRVGFYNKVRGHTKIITGWMICQEDRVEEGKRIKHGEV